MIVPFRIRTCVATIFLLNFVSVILAQPISTPRAPTSPTTPTSPTAPAAPRAPASSPSTPVATPVATVQNNTNATNMPSSMFPSDKPSETPSLMPTVELIQPSTQPSDTPTITAIVNTTKPTPTKRPSRKPTRMSTDKPTRASRSPSMKPVVAGKPESTTVANIEIKYKNVPELNAQEVSRYKKTFQEWFDDSFNLPINSTGGNRQLLGMNSRWYHRFLQVTSQIGSMNSTIAYLGQTVGTDSNGDYVAIKYDHTLNYIAGSGAPDSNDVALLPFPNLLLNEGLVARLRSIDAFNGLDAPIDVPVIRTETGQQIKEQKFPVWAIIAIAVGGTLCLCLALYVGGRSMNSDKDNYDMTQPSSGGGYNDSNNKLPPSQFNINAAEDVSLMDDPTVAKVGANDNASIGHYGDQSVATVDYDYSKAYGGGGDTSVVSSVGGTLGDATRQTANDMGINSLNSARLALGASNFGGDQDYKEEIIIINAPAGKLGVVIDTPDDGAPVVHAVKDTSVIADQVQVGDKLIAVDDDDVRSMTAIKVSKLISKKSANPNRKLTVVRTTPL